MVKMKKQTVVPFIDLFEQKYSVSLNATIKFFDNHNFKQLKERSELILLGDMSNVRHLAHTLVDLFEFHTDFIGYYEGMYKYRKVPHYEDAIVLYTIIITTFAAIGTWVSPIIGEEYKEFKKKREKEKKSINPNLILDEFEYFIKAYAILQSYYFGLIS